MKKITFLWIIIVLAICISGTYYYLTRQESIILDELSARAKAYIEEKQKDQSSEWRLKNIGKGKHEVVVEPQKQKETFATDCFKIVVPFSVLKSQLRGDCTLDISTDDPRGRLLVMVQGVGAAKVDDIDQVVMRRSQPEVYTERRLNVDGREFIIFRTKQDTYESVAITHFQGNSVSVSFFTANNASYDTTLEEMVRTLELAEAK